MSWGGAQSLSSLYLPRQPPLHNDIAKVAGFQAIFRETPCDRSPVEPLNLPERTLSTFWAETRDSSLFGKRLAVVFDQCSSSGT